MFYPLGRCEGADDKVSGRRGTRSPTTGSGRQHVPAGTRSSSGWGLPNERVGTLKYGEVEVGQETVIFDEG
jgi:hypothetical protein